MPGVDASLARRLALGAAIAATVVLAGCGSGGRSDTATNKAGAPATTRAATTPASTAVAPPAFTACMARAHWRHTGTPADAGAKTLLAQPGVVTSAALTGPAGDRVSVAFFSTAKQAERAQVLTGESVGGNGHSTSTPGEAIAWINYSGHTAVDRKVAACASAARA
jgi:outer membrane murein-binding lipoprotein Lpp